MPPNHRQLSISQPAALLPLHNQITVIPPLRDVTRGATCKHSTSIATTRSQSAAKRRRLDLSSAAEADVLPTDQGADTLARADIPRIVDAVLRSLPHSSTVMPTNDARDDLEQEYLANDLVDPPLGKW